MQQEEIKDHFLGHQIGVEESHGGAWVWGRGKGGRGEGRTRTPILLSQRKKIPTQINCPKQGDVGLEQPTYFDPKVTV